MFTLSRGHLAVRPWRLAALGIAGLILAASCGWAQTTNSPGIIPIVPSGTPGIPGSLQPPIPYAYPLLDTNGAIVWPPHFWDTNAPSIHSLGTNVFSAAAIAWIETLASGTNGVSSFNGRNGAVTLTSNDVTNALGGAIAAITLPGRGTFGNITDAGLVPNGLVGTDAGNNLFPYSAGYGVTVAGGAVSWTPPVPLTNSVQGSNIVGRVYAAGVTSTAPNTNTASAYFGTSQQGNIDTNGVATLPTMNVQTLNVGTLNITNPPSFNLINSTNLPSTNVLVSAVVLSASSSQTNYTVDLYPGPSGNLETIYMANTNAFITFTGTNQANWHRTVLFRGWTNAIVTRIQFVSPVRTNLNFVGFVTNGMAKVINFYNTDTTGTNVLVSDAGSYQ